MKYLSREYDSLPVTSPHPHHCHLSAPSKKKQPNIPARGDDVRNSQGKILEFEFELESY